MSKLCAPTFLVVLAFAVLAQAQTFITLYNFTDHSDGGEPRAGIIQDPAGNIYGTAEIGGNRNCFPPTGCGVVFKLNTAGAETVLHTFMVSPDGSTPETPVVRDEAGNIYGTTSAGGSASGGTVFKIATAMAVLHSFTWPDGWEPLQGLVRDQAGNLYGTTFLGGSYGNGAIFEVDSAGNFILLHSFAGPPSEGTQPVYGHLTIDKSGNLYGLTGLGGAYDLGSLYKLSRHGKLTLLHSFGSGSDGCHPYGSVIQDEAGNLYGTTYRCGVFGYGTIWKVSKNGKETILHNFVGGVLDGCGPDSGVARDSKGNLYGLATYCGANSYYGALYEWSAKGRLTLLHSFDYSDGYNPIGEVLRTAKGELFGTTYWGGAYGFGTVWKYMP